MSEQKFVVRLSNGVALKFHTNVCGRRYEVAADQDATKFDGIIEAMEKADLHGVRKGTYSIEPLNP